MYFRLNLRRLLAMTRVSEVHGFSKPLMTDNPMIRISNGRHPLQELCVRTFVQNDTHLKKSLEMRVKIDDDIDIIESRKITPFSAVVPMTPNKQRSGTLSNVVQNKMQDIAHSTMIITGANGSGKSVYLKQVGLIVILAQIGWYVTSSSGYLADILVMFQLSLQRLASLINVSGLVSYKLVFSYGSVHTCNVQRIIIKSKHLEAVRII